MDSAVGTAPGGRSEAGCREAASSHRPVSRTWLIAALLLLLSAASVAVLDRACLNYASTHRLPDELADFFDAAEHFGTPYGAVLILVTVWMTHPTLRSRVSRTLVAPITAGLVADVFKLCVSRTRPNSFDFYQSIGSSFGGVLQWGAGGSQQQSFPSAHTAFAMAFAVMLGELFPKGRRWFLCLGALVALHRVTTLAHFPSDVLAGAAVGLVTARYFLGTAPLGLVYDRMERHYFPDAVSVPVGGLMASSPAVIRAEPARSL